ncbi:predicted protein [Phaeodactylum tricornutum CCAP 1055/1]|uniref:Uncharacterized protein n=1 Tax=Phaeodactylum tricornutum (strain CCAP 1055/1) TaxID=556484 RepID=B7G7X3_PHATC|nr:predicted protein [Phaeodactylum tricornutum CCAP 1055/1]EEC45438.1 predicted protein [Phaeodactylum tricornutum CCAP 1055/1]|eukprot:XP_002183220.1 predicted protein [Phaeodactylum tricornutum CCAP 1055/1]
MASMKTSSQRKNAFERGPISPSKSVLRSPPSQIYTRGTVGSVMTGSPRRRPSPRYSHSNSLALPRRPRSKSPSRESRSRVHLPQSHRRSRSASSQPIVSSSDSLQRTPVSTRSIISHPQPQDETRSAHSSRSYPPKKHVDFRDDPNASSSSKRDPSPAPSSGSAKVHIKATKSVMEELSKAPNTEQRIVAITNACELLDHYDETYHNAELALGVASALIKRLQYSYGDAETPHKDITIVNIFKVLLSLSRPYELRASLLRQSSMMDLLKRTATNQTLPADAKLVRLNFIAFLAKCDANKSILYESEEVLDGILRIANGEVLDLGKLHAVTILMELASDPTIQVRMAFSDRILGTLVKLLLVENTKAAREAAITALQNLAFRKENRLRLVTFKSGIVLEALKNALTKDTDSKSRRRAAGALTNLACEETVAIMGKYSGLLEALAIVTTTDEVVEVQTRACLALTKIAGNTTIKMESFKPMLDALIVASLSKKANSISAVFRVKARDAENRNVMALYPGLLDTLSDVCLSERANIRDKDNSVHALMHLVNEEQNRLTMGQNAVVLEALVAAASYTDASLVEARDSAIIALERLATEHSVRPGMARHPSLLTVVAAAVERETAWHDQGRDCEHDYLAKPLLMSLLIAI